MMKETQQIENEQHNQHKTQPAPAAGRPAIGIPAAAAKKNENNDKEDEHQDISW